jgi:hypothetical protein
MAILSIPLALRRAATNTNRHTVLYQSQKRPRVARGGRVKIVIQ